MIGVKAIVVKIEVEIANEVLVALKSNWSVSNDKVTVKVEDGWVTLESELQWSYQSDAAKIAIYLAGATGITNNIKIRSETHDAIEKAISGSWTVDNNDINVLVSGTTVMLSGTVNSWYQKKEADHIAWNTRALGM